MESGIAATRLVATAADDVDICPNGDHIPAVGTTKCMFCGYDTENDK